MVYFHKYFLTYQNIESDLDKYCICIASILTASKFCDQLIPLDKLILIGKDLFNVDTKSNSVQNIISLFKDKVFFFEFEILNCLGFDLNVSLPYKYIIQMKNYFNEYLKNPKIYQICYYYINDSFKLPLCLYYHPLYIALACMYLLEVNFNMKLPVTSKGLKWFEIIEPNVNLDIVKEVAFYLNRIYEAEKTNTKVSIPETIIIFDALNKKEEAFGEVKMDLADIEYSNNTVHHCEGIIKSEEIIGPQDISGNSTISTAYFGNEYNKRD
jgi:hypothetical protein